MDGESQGEDAASADPSPGSAVPRGGLMSGVLTDDEVLVKDTSRSMIRDGQRRVAMLEEAVAELKRIRTGEPEPAPTPETTVHVAVLTRGDPRVETVGSMHRIQALPRVKSARYHPGLYIHNSRNEAVTVMLASDADILLFVDDDMLFTEAAFNAVLAKIDAGAHIAGGVYWSPTKSTSDPSDEVMPVVLKINAGRRDDLTFRDTFVHEPFPRGWTANRREPFICDAIGTGFMAITRTCLEHMRDVHPAPLHWFAFDTIMGVSAGEDLTFCYRAQQLGYDIWAVPPPTRDDLLHVKTVYIGAPLNAPES